MNSGHDSWSFSNSYYELEMNLHSVRLSLIQMIEDFEAEDCKRCACLKCQCTSKTASSLLSSLTDSGQSSDSNAYKSPPAIQLPRPEFKTESDSEAKPEASQVTVDYKDVEAWVRASTPSVGNSPTNFSFPESIDDPVHYSWPPTQKSVWNEYKEKINKQEINTDVGNSNVQDFFKSFTANLNSQYASAMANLAEARNKVLKEKLKEISNKSAEYSDDEV